MGAFRVTQKIKEVNYRISGLKFKDSVTVHIGRLKKCYNDINRYYKRDRERTKRVTEAPQEGDDEVEEEDEWHHRNAGYQIHREREERKIARRPIQQEAREEPRRYNPRLRPRPNYNDMHHSCYNRIM